MRQGDVYDAVRRLARRLEEEGLDYVVIGGMAVVEHDSRRTTEDIGVLMRRETLLELELASGTSALHRLRDLADVQDLILRARLPLELADRLDPSVRAEYGRLWHTVREAPPPDGGS